MQSNTSEKTNSPLIHSKLLVSGRSSEKTLVISHDGSHQKKKYQKIDIKKPLVEKKKSKQV